MELNIIQSDGTWGHTSSVLNDNFVKIDNAIEQLQYSTTRFKGHFINETSLKTVLSSPSIGEYAYVGTYPGTVYDCIISGTWRSTGEAAPGNSINLNEYATLEALSTVEIAAKGALYNASLLDASGNNIFTLDTALSSVPERYRKVVTLITFLGYGIGNVLQSYTYQFNANDINKFTDISAWTRIASGAYIDERVKEMKEELSLAMKYDDVPLLSRISSLESKVSGIENIEGLGLVLVADSEHKCGIYRIAGTELDLYECTFKIESLPSVTDAELEYIISENPLGNKSYVAVRDFIVTDGESFYPANYRVSKVYVDTEYHTRVLLKCMQPLDANHYAYLALKYVKFDGVKVEIKIHGIPAVEIEQARLEFPPLKFGKKFAYSYTFDDDVVQAYGKAFNLIHKKWIDNEKFYHVGQEKTTGSIPVKALGYTDGLEGERRFTFGVAVWPDMSSSQIDNYMKPGNHAVDKYYPYLVWDDFPPLLNFGNEIYLHDVNTAKYGKDVNGIELGMKASQAIILENTHGHGSKVLARPNGDNKYVTAGRHYADVEFMLVENSSDIGAPLNVTFNNDVELKKATQYRRYTEPTPAVSQLMPYIDERALAGTYAWVHDFSHAPADFQYILDLFTTINDKYGKDGLDSVWFASVDEVYEYWFMRKYSKIRKVIENDGVRFTLFIPNLKYNRHRDFTLQLPNVSYSTSLSASLLTKEQVYGFAWGNIDGHFSVNINLEKKINEMADSYTDIYINSLSSDDKEDALYFINQLRTELKSIMMEKIATAEVQPVLNAIFINGGDSTTYTDKVIVSFDCVGKFSHYKLSESADMTSLSWVEGTSKKINLTLSTGYAKKTIYAAIKNSFGESVVRSSNITYAEVTADTVILNSLKINNGATSTTDSTVTVSLSVNGTPTHYMISESSTFVGTTWQLYSLTALPFTLSSGNGLKTVYLKIKNATSESNVKSAIITLGSGGSVNPPVEQNSKTIACFNSVVSLAGYNGLNVNNAQQILKDISGKNYITFLRNDTAGDSADSRPIVLENYNPEDVAGAPYPYEVYKIPVNAYGKSGTEKHLHFSVKDGSYKIKIYANIKLGNEGDSVYRVYAINGEEKIPDFEIKGNVSNFLTWENVSPVDGKIKITMRCAKDWVAIPVNVIEFEKTA